MLDSIDKVLFACRVQDFAIYKGRCYDRHHITFLNMYILAYRGSYTSDQFI